MMRPRYHFRSSGLAPDAFGSLWSVIWHATPMGKMQDQIGDQLQAGLIAKGVPPEEAQALGDTYRGFAPTALDVGKGLLKTFEIAAPALVAIAAPVAIPALAGALGMAAPTAAESVLGAVAATSTVVKPAIAQVKQATNGIDLSGLGVSAPSLSSPNVSLPSLAPALVAPSARPVSKAPTSVGQTGFAPLPLPAVARVTGSNAAAPKIDVAGLDPVRWTITSRGLVSRGPAVIYSTPQWLVFGDRVMRVG